MGQENRRSPRFPFVAVADITHTNSGERLDSRVAELSVNGCYVDMLNTFPVGDEIVIKIFAESECFEAIARVVYAHANLGMGLASQQVSLKNGALLRQWLQKASDAAK
jgi:hypothetical protein